MRFLSIKVNSTAEMRIRHLSLTTPRSGGTGNAREGEVSGGRHGEGAGVALGGARGAGTGGGAGAVASWTDGCCALAFLTGADEFGCEVLDEDGLVSLGYASNGSEDSVGLKKSLARL